MLSPLEQRLQFAYGILYDARRWIEAIAADVPALDLQTDSALDHIEQAQGAIEEAKMAARMKDGLMAIATASVGEDEP